MKIQDFFHIFQFIFALLADPDQNPTTQINADACKSGSGYRSGSETLDVSTWGGSASQSILPQNDRIRRYTEPKTLRFPKRTYHHDLLSSIAHAYSLEKHNCHLRFPFDICYFPFIIWKFFLLFIISYLLFVISYFLFVIYYTGWQR